MTSEAETRVRRNVEKRCGDTLPDLDLRRELARVVARHVAGDPGKVACTEGGRVRMSPAILKRLDYVAQSLNWIAKSDAQVGEQAAATAGKTLRAVRSARADFDRLETLCRKFRSAKRAHERRLSESRPRAKRMTVQLGNGWQSIRIVTERDLVAAGRRFRNCLAGHDLSKTHRKWLRDGSYQYWALEDETGEMTCLLRIDPECDTIDEAKGVRNEMPFGSREALLEFMDQRDLTVATSDLTDIGICDELVAAFSQEKLQVFERHFGAVAWTLHIAPGLLVGHAADSSFILHGESVDDYRPFSRSGSDDYWQQAALRCMLRRICRHDTDLAAALTTAFVSAAPVLVDDWFGLQVAGAADSGEEVRQ